MIEQRKVIYEGVELVVPFDTVYLGTDSKGVVTAHYERPWTEPDYWEGYELGEITQLPVPDDWTDSLVKYDDMSLTE